MKVILKFLLVLLAAMVLVGVVYKITNPAFAPSTDPEQIPVYNDVVPRGMSAMDAPRVLDPRDADVLIEPRLSIVKISDSIVARACQVYSDECAAKALYAWVQQEVEYVEVLPSRDYIISPEETLLYRQMDDLTGSILLASLLRAQNLPVSVSDAPYSSFVTVGLSTGSIRLDSGCGSCRFGQIRYNGNEQDLVILR